MSLNSLVNDDYTLYSHQWEKNKDCSRDLVHQAKQKYLPDNTLPPAALQSEENRQLNAYIKHKYEKQVWPMSVFFNFTRPTIGAWIGLIMMKKPTIKFTDTADTETKLDYLNKNADGCGNNLSMISRLGLEAAIETGGGGFLVVNPEEKMTLQSVKDGSIAPRIKTYDRENILDWDSAYINSTKQLTYLKLRETESISDGLVSESVEKHIEYFLTDSGVTFRITQGADDNDERTKEGELIENGKQAVSIPFYWFGANDNDESPDPAPVTPIADLNVLHYQLYSRHVQQCYDAGQGQYHIDLGNYTTEGGAADNQKAATALKELNPGGLKMGSLAPIVTANGGSVNLLQLSTDSLLGEEPGKIEERAIKIGAQMITQDENQTATAVRISFGASTSNLVTISENVSMALKAAIVRIAGNIDANPDLVQFELNKKLVTEQLTAQDRQSFMQMVMQGVMPLRALFRILQRSGEVPDEWAYDDFKAELEEDQGFLDLIGGGVGV